MCDNAILAVNERYLYGASCKIDDGLCGPIWTIPVLGTRKTPFPSRCVDSSVRVGSCWITEFQEELGFLGSMWSRVSDFDGVSSAVIRRQLTAQGSYWKCESLDVDVFMDVSHETPAQTRRRLLTVIACADLRVLDGTYAFEEFPVTDFPRRADSTARALVRDDETWSQLVPCADATRELFVLFSFHFPTGLDNSGFVGWLASDLKARLGTGVFVVCGQNSARGGIFDYWGCPARVVEKVIAEIERLRRQRT